jgi:hypothetical protein
MFGVRIVVLASVLFGAGVSMPLDLAEAKSSKGSYGHYLRKSYAKHHAPTAYRHAAWKSNAKHHVANSYGRYAARKSYGLSARKSTAPKITVTASASARVGVGARPARWCGWWLRTQLGGGPELNLARNWKSWGRPSGAQIGAVVVWSHHVGIITGRAANGQWIVKSGNDGGRVRERPRSVAGAVFRTSA